MEMFAQGRTGMEDAKTHEVQPETAGRNLIQRHDKRQREAASILAWIFVVLVSSALLFYYAKDLATFLTSYPSDIDRNTGLVRFAAVAAFVIVFGIITYLYASGSPVFQLHKAPTGSTAGTSGGQPLDLPTLADALDGITHAAQDIKNS